MLGVPFIEAYGLTETAATTHNNPFERPKRQCLGVPFFNTESVVVDPVTRALLAPGEQGEIAVRGPQLFKGYWNRSTETAEAFATIGGHVYFLTGDIGYVDAEGYWFMTDRAKRMINASGYKVWPAEIENRLYEHPAVLEACVIGTQDAYRGESVKAVIVLSDEARGRVDEAEVIAWSKARMAAYKYPRHVEFVDALPKSLNGKILWRELQQREDSNQTTKGLT
jgi:fatty-acyl-CoA synthase